MIESCARLILLVLTGACGPTGDVKARDVFADPRVTPMAEAVARGDAPRISQLAAEGVDVNARGDKDVTLLQWALLNKSKRGLSALLDAGADPSQPGIGGDTVVHLAAFANDDTYLDILLKHGVDPNAPNGVTRATPIVSALMGERESQFRMLLAAGADPGRTDRMGNTPVHAAAKINEPWRIVDLLEAGAPPAALNHQGVTFQRYLFMTPEEILSEDARRGRAAVIDWLQRHDIPVEASSPP